MAHSGNTTNFNLPQFTGTDHPSFTGDFNEAFLSIDNFLKDISTLAEQAQAAASAAQTKADEAYDKASQGGGFDLDKVYPVGAIYMSMGSTDPGTLFGGTWNKIEGRFLYAVEADSVPTGTTGGEAMHTLTEAEMPSHSHSGSGTAKSTGSHRHSLDDRWTGSVSSGSWLARGRASSDYCWGPTTRTINTDSDGSHSHSVSLSIGNAGSGQAHNNMPPYIAVNCWQRTA